MTKEIVRAQAHSPTPDQRNRGFYPADIVELAQEASVGVVTVEQSGAVRWINRAAADALGYDREHLAGTAFRDLFLDPEDCDKLLGAAFAGDVTRGRLVTLRDLGGEARTFAFDGDAVWHEGQAHARFLLRDLTPERRSAESNRLRADILDAVGEAVVTTDTEGRVTYWNKAAEDLYGWTAAEILGKSVFDVLVPKDESNADKDLLEALAEGRAWSGEFIVLRRDGTPFPAFVSDTPLKDESGNVIGFVCVSVNMTEQRASESALRESRELYRLVVDNALHMISLCDMDGRIVFASPSHKAALGWRPDDLVGKTLDELIQTEGSGPPPWTDIQDSPQARTFRGRIRHKNRRRLAIEGAVLQVSGPDASTPYLLCMYRDITSEVDAEKELRARERKTEVLADALPAIVGIASRDRGFYYFNRAWYAYTGLTLEESTPAPWSTVIHPDDYPLVWDWVQAVYSGRMIEQEIRYRRHDGAYRWFLTRSVPMAPLGDDPGSAVLTAVDITDIKEANQATESARKQLETVLRGITDGVTAQDRHGNLIYANQAAADLIGYATVEELLEAPPASLAAGFDIEDEHGGKVLAADLPGAESRRAEPTGDELFLFRDHETAEERFGLIKAAPVFDTEGEVDYIVNIFRDVSDKVLAERERESLLEREREARVAAERAASRMATLQEVTALLSKALTQQEVGDIIVSRGVEATGAIAGALGLLDRDEVFLASVTGYDADFVRNYRRFTLVTPAPITHAITTGEEIFVGPQEVESRFPGLRSLGSRSWAAMPIRSGGDTIGAISISFAPEQTFGEEDRDLIRTLATVCSQAMDRARLYEVERSLRGEAQVSADLLLRVQRVTDAALAHPDLRELPHLLEAIREVIESDTISITLVDETGEFLQPVASLGLEEEVELGARVRIGDGFTGRIAASQKPLIVDDPENFPFVNPIFAQKGFRSVAGIPLVVGGHVTGVLYAGLYSSTGFSSWHIRLLELVADRVALALAQSRLFEAERRSREEAESIRERVSRLQTITAALAAALTPQEVAEVVLEVGKQSMNAASAAVALLNHDGLFEFTGSQGYTDGQIEAWRTVPPNTRRPVSDVVATGEPIFFRDRAEMRARYPDLATHVPQVHVSSACLPLKAGSRALGALLIGFNEVREIPREDRDFMMAIAQQCALALARTRLYEAERLARSNAEDAEARYRLLAESIPQIVWTAARDGSIDYYNDQYYRFTGLPAGEGMGRDWVDAVHPDDRERAIKALQDAVASGEGFQTELRKRSADGSYCWFLERALPVRDAAGRVIRWLGTCTDIDDQKRSQERLEFLAEATAILSSSLAFEETLADVTRLVVRDISDWCTVHVLNEDGTISYLAVANEDPELCRLAQELEAEEPLPLDSNFGYAYALRTGKPQMVKRLQLERLRSAALGERRAALMERFAITSAICVPVQVRGKVRAALSIANSHAQRVLDTRDLQTAQEIARHISFAIDNALLYRDSQAVQEELRRANEAKDEFLGLMSHELRTPITTLFGGAKILRSRGRYLDEEHKESLLSDIENEAEGMHRMIEDLLVLARTGSGERVGTEPILANRVVEKVMRGFQLHKPNRKLEIRSEQDLLPVMADTTYLEQVLRNLISNADKYSPATLAIEIELHSEGEEVVITVQDRGSGIDAAEAELIFTRFYRAERTARGVRGMGLGLTVCRKLVEAQGGRIWARPREGGGTEVSFALPAFSGGEDDAE